MFSSIQIYLFLKCLLLGICFGFVYSIFKIFKTKLNIFVTAVLDFILFFIVGLGQFLIFLTQNYAKIALFGIISTIIGFIIVDLLMTYIIKTIFKTTRKTASKEWNNWLKYFIIIAIKIN